jgi:hypothetical protein
MIFVLYRFTFGLNPVVNLGYPFILLGTGVSGA